MRTSLFQVFRQRDGRSLTRAMAFLLAIHALVLGLDAGTMAAAASAGTAICSVGGAADIPGAPAHHRDGECCLAGCATPAPTEPPAVAGLPARSPVSAPVSVPAAPRIAAPRIDAASPRGPPGAA